MARRHRPCQEQVTTGKQRWRYATWRWLGLLILGGGLSSWHGAQAWSQELTGGMQLILEELRQLKKVHVEAMVEIEDLRRQVQTLSAGGLVAASYRLPTKAEFAGEPVPLYRRDVWERLDQEFLMYIGRPAQVMLWLKRMGKHMPLIEQQLRQYGLPDDLKYLAVVESSLRPTAVSSAGAGGLWQFIESTGRQYDMGTNPFVDERMDVGKATGGAMQYLGRLYEIFQNWPLALAGYNAGEGRVLDELREQRVDSYYDLALPAETERFVYKIIAMKIILSDAARYGIVIDEQEHYQAPETDVVTVRVDGSRLHLRTVAEAAGTHYAMIKHLNPQLRQRHLPRGAHQVLVPKGGATAFAENFQETYEPEPVAVSKPLSVKAPPPAAPSRPQGSAARKTIRYEVKKGDTLSRIAARFDASVESLMKWNKLANASHITPGRQLVILQD